MEHMEHRLTAGRPFRKGWKKICGQPRPSSRRSQISTSSESEAVRPLQTWMNPWEPPETRIESLGWRGPRLTGSYWPVVVC